MAVADADASFVDAANSSFEDPPSSERVAGVLLGPRGDAVEQRPGRLRAAGPVAVRDSLG